MNATQQDLDEVVEREWIGEFGQRVPVKMKFRDMWPADQKKHLEAKAVQAKACSDLELQQFKIRSAAFACLEQVEKSGRMTAREVLRTCIREANGDLEAALAAADHLFELDEQVPSEQEPELSMKEEYQRAERFMVRMEERLGAMESVLFALDAGDGIALSVRQIGEVWQGKSGRYYTRRESDGHVVPAKAPGEGTGRKPGAAPAESKDARAEAPKGKPSLLSRVMDGIKSLGFMGKTQVKGHPFKDVSQLSPRDRADNSLPRETFMKELAEHPTRKKQWEAFARSQNMSVEEAQKKVVSNLEKMVDGLDPYIRVSVLHGMGRVEGILDKGYLTQFHSGITSEHALNDLRKRRVVEEKSMGCSADTPADERPRYCYLSDGSKHPRKEAVDTYGDVVIKLKPEVKKNMSVSFGNSLMGADNGWFAAGWPGEFTPEVIDPAALAYHGMGITESFDAFDTEYRRYIEGHLHQEIPTTAIESIAFPEYAQPDEAMQAKLKSLGIKWSVWK